MTQSSSPTRFSAVLPASGKPAYLGMWTWLFQRASSLILMILLPWHWVNPYSRPVRIAVLFFVIFHAAAGVRVMLMDFGLAERWHRGLVWTLGGSGSSSSAISHGAMPKEDMSKGRGGGRMPVEKSLP